jgi:8-oxo-dGTP pyrophosphatase MutT (NUDIX family)
VKLLLLDDDDRLLLIHASDPQTQAECWYPVGGGVDAAETLQQAAAREAHEETGLSDLPPGLPVWRRDHTYEFDGRVIEVHEEWLMHRVDRFDPAPANLTEYESRTILGFRWWRAHELTETPETTFPPRLGRLLMNLLANGAPASPIDISSR